MRFLLLSFVLVVCGCGASGENQFHSACVDAIQKRLKAPSTFELVEATADHQKIPPPAEEEIRSELAKLKGREDAESRARQARLYSDLASRNEYNALALKLLIEYDAQNALGVPLRSIVTCTAQTDADGKFSKEDAWKVEIDDETHTDWIVNQVKRQQ